MRIRYDNIKHTYRWRTWNRWNKPYIYNRNNMHVVCKWCRWRYTIHLRVFAVCHTYKISQMSVQSQRASSPIRGTGNILTHENTKGRGIQFHSGYWKNTMNMETVFVNCWNIYFPTVIWAGYEQAFKQSRIPNDCPVDGDVTSRSFDAPYVFHWSTVLALRYTVWSPCI